MKQNNTPIVLIGLTLALVAVLAIAPIVSEMAYASNRRGGGGGAGGGPGGSGSTSSIASCNAPQTCSAEATTGGSGFISLQPLVVLILAQEHLRALSQVAMAPAAAVVLVVLAARVATVVV